MATRRRRPSARYAANASRAKRPAPEGGVPAAAAAVLDFWLGEAVERAGLIPARNALWFGADPAVDTRIAGRFGRQVEAASRGRLRHWMRSPGGRLALVILLDQFRRNLFRGRADAYALDDRALALTRAGLARGEDGTLRPLERAFLYLPLQHSEALPAQIESVTRYEALLESIPPAERGYYGGFLRHARLHHGIVARFGRFPHRNGLLGRSSTVEELRWLADGGPRFGQ